MGTSANASAPLYRIRIRLDAQTVQAYGRHMPLKSGMLVQASVMLERRKLYEWIVEPIFSISGRL
jgi:membrane fusion protein